MKVQTKFWKILDSVTTMHGGNVEIVTYGVGDVTSLKFAVNQSLAPDVTDFPQEKF